jgi:hypothetical protein
LAYTTVDMAEIKETLRQIQDKQENEKRPDTGVVKLDSRETYARVPPEVKSWMQKLEEDPANMKTVTDDSGQPILQTTAPQNPKIKLPLGRSKFVAGFKKTIDDAGKWLSTFILRLIKKNDGKVKFKEEE